MSEDTDILKALSDPTRLRIIAFLSECDGPVAVEDSGLVRPVCGPTVGEVCCRITGEDRITSTISHHLKELRLAGLITMEKRGRHILCSLQREPLLALSEQLKALAERTGARCT